MPDSTQFKLDFTCVDAYININRIINVVINLKFSNFCFWVVKIVNKTFKINLYIIFNR